MMTLHQTLEECIAASPYAVYLKTALVTGNHRFSMIGLDPLVVLEVKGRRGVLQTPQGTSLLSGDPFALLQQFLDEYRSFALPLPPRGGEGSRVRGDQVFPFNGGAIVALGYGLRETIEPFATHAVDDLGLPDLSAVIFRNYYIIDELSKDLLHVDLTKRSGAHRKTSNATGDTSPAFDRPQRMRAGERGLMAGPVTDQSFTMSSTFTRDAYIAAVRRVIEYIKAGDIYQANLSQRFEAPCAGESFELFQKMVRVNPAPMMAYLKTPAWSIISSSPERFLKRTGTRVETSPIKGTRPRGATPEEDERLKAILWNSSKDNAELAMIVDLMRNDLGKLAMPGSVRVTDPKRIESYASVHHLVATVQAEVSAKVSSVDLIKACFPGGSITGCPKRRAMEIIEEIEPVKRGSAYGSIGYLSFNGDFDLSIAIRTLIQKNQKLYFNLGGGIVADSDPEQEYEETLHKGSLLLKLLEKETRKG